MATEEKKTLAQLFKIECPQEINKDHTVVIVEDQTDMRLIIVHHLNKLGFKKIHQAGNGYDCLEFLKASHEPVSIIVSAMNMPVLGGLELLAELRDDPRYKRPPFALAMQQPDKDKIMFALENGVDEILVKPFTLNDIMPRLVSGFRKFHNPQNPEKVYEYAKDLARQGKNAEAFTVYQLIAQETKTTARPWVGMARILLKEKKYDEADTALAEAEKRNPNFVHVYSVRGDLYNKLQKTEDSIAAYKKAIELSPLNPIRYEAAAAPLFALQRYEEGVSVLQLAVEKELNFPSLHNYLSQGYYALRDYKKALRHIKTALSAQPENVTFLNQLGISLKELGEVDEAMKTYNQIIKLDQENRAAWYNKAVLQHSMGQAGEAVHTLQKAVKKFPDFKPAQNKLDEYLKAGTKPNTPNKTPGAA